eukprot:7345315-Lingulodinium_polyedra.AAC.1
MATTLAHTVLSIYAYATRCECNCRVHLSSPQGLLERPGVKKNGNNFGSNGALYICVRDWM